MQWRKITFLQVAKCSVTNARSRVSVSKQQSTAATVKPVET